MRLLHYAVAIYLALTACGPLPKFYNQRDFVKDQEAQAQELPFLEHAPSSQPTPYQSQLDGDMLRLPAGYTAHKSLRAIIREIHVAYAGELRVKKKGRSRYIEAEMRPNDSNQNLDTMIRMLSDADTNGDHVISKAEAFTLREEVYEKEIK